MAINFKTGKVQTDKEALKRYTKNILEALENGEENFEDYGAKDIEYIMRMSEILAMQCRSTLEVADKDMKNFDYFTKERTVKDNDFYENNLPVFVKSFPKMLYIFTPLTFKRPLKNSFTLANYVAEKLEKMKENNELSFKCDGHYSFVVIRKTMKFNSNSICDNDNFETSRMINAISRALNKSDNATQFDFISSYEITKNEDEVGLHIYLVPQADFKKMLKENVVNFNDNSVFL